MSRKPNLLLAPATDKARNSMMSSLVLGTGNVDIISIFLSAMNFSLRPFFQQEQPLLFLFPQIQLRLSRLTSLKESEQKKQNY
jgi:hypothetical protein